MPEQPKKLQPVSPLALPQTRKQAKRKPLGPGLTWSDGAIDALSEVGPDDIEAALALWQSEVPAPLKNLLRAKTGEQPK